MNRPSVALLGALAVLAPLAACTDNKASSGEGALTVTSTDDKCELSATSAPSGTISFEVENKGSKVTEFYLLKSDGLTVAGEIENITPGLKRKLVLQAGPGTYVTACKPGMIGKGIRADFTVTDSGKSFAPTGKDAELVDAASKNYAAYVDDQAEQLLEQTKEFAQLYIDKKDDEARTLYPNARMHWERIEPVAESFGDLDPMLDLREADLEPGQEWTGWHAIEKDLWAPEPAQNGGETYVPLTDAQRKALADGLVKNTETLVTKVHGIKAYTADQMGNGAKSLLDEVANGKVTGEEEIWSHTDLWDFQANVEGARVAYEGLKPVLERKKETTLEKELDTQFANVEKLLDQYKTADGWKLYTDLDEDQVKELADAVNALAEPLSKLTAAVIN
jgi:iron uptake system component EfeO